MDAVYIRARRDVNNGQRHEVDIGFRATQDAISDLIVAAHGLAVIAYEEWTAQGDNLTLSVLLEYDQEIALVSSGRLEPRAPLRSRVRRRHDFGAEFVVSRRYREPNEVLQNLPQAFIETIEKLLQSDRTLRLHDLSATLRFDRAVQYRARAGAGKRVPSYVRKSIANDTVGGLARYDTQDGLCGYQAIIWALALKQQLRDSWTGSFDWFLSEMSTPSDVRALRSKKRFVKLAEHLRRYLGESDDWLVSLGNGSTANRLVQMQPMYQVLIYNEATRQLMEDRRGALFDEHADNETAMQHTIILTYTLGHVRLVNHIKPYLGYRGDQTFCYNCYRFSNEQHPCRSVEQCDKCFVRFITEEHAREHMKRGRGEQAQCLMCERRFYNDTCLNAHRCRATHFAMCIRCKGKLFPHQQHQCGEYRCNYCRKKVVSPHRCTIEKLEEPEQLLRPEDCGANYWAFDFEAMLLEQPDGTFNHEVNLVVLKRCFGEEELIMYSLEQFMLWIEARTEETTLFAHNLKGYDGRLLFDYLFEKHTPPQSIIWNGSKIMTMTYGRVSFKDTLLHLPASLEQLPKMFGLDEREFKKGFFPYLFNVPANQNYIGAPPDRNYFDPDNMMAKKRGEFERWYNEQVENYLWGEQYDFKEELVAYCRSDTKILARAIEAYMREQMAIRPMDPFSCLTIASYALTMYRTFFMPDNQLYALHSDEYEGIYPSMHGGRTDCRRLLKEWSAEELAEGIYGKYQDVQSLYPTVQFYDPMPVGVPRLRQFEPHIQPSVEELRQVFGFVCCDIHCTRYLHHPVIVETEPTTMRLLADLRPKRKIVVPTPELQLALDNGYVVTRVYYWYEFDQSTELFKSYFREFLKAKIVASGMPKWVRTDEDWQEFQTYHQQQLGIELRRDEMVANPGKKTGAKLLCNSLWGKFGERPKADQWRTYETGKDDDDVMYVENNWMDGNLEIMFRRTTTDGKCLGMMVRWSNMDNYHYSTKNRRSKTNIALASMVTSHARCRLWKEMHKLGDRVLYHDTDSIIYEHNPRLYNIPEGKYLGEWEDETDGLPIVKFVSTGPKCYAYGVLEQTGDIKYSVKAKGFTLNTGNQDMISYEKMKALMIGDISHIEANALLFKFDKHSGGMTTKSIKKMFTMTYEKGEYDREDWKVYPYGWNLFHETFPYRTNSSR